MGTVQMVQVTPEELKTMIVEGVKEVIEHLLPNVKPSAEKELYTKKEAITTLKISLSTLNNWIKSGKLPAHGIGNRVFLKKSEIDQALIKLN